MANLASSPPGSWHLLFLGYPTVALSVVLSALVAFFLYMRFCYLPFKVLKRNGICGPTPSFFYGNYKQLNKMGIMNFLEQLHKDYGPSVGYYLGQSPQLSTTDLELIKLVTIKEFDTFINRPMFPDLVRKKPGPSGLLRSRDETWRFSRKTLSPTFSPFKMKAMTPLIQSGVDTLVEVLQNYCDSGQSVEVFKLYGSFTMETTLAAAFGRVMDIQRGQSDELTKAAAALFSGVQEGKKSSRLYVTTLLSNFPWSVHVLRYLLRGNERQVAFFMLQETASRLIQQRRDEKSKPGKYQDLLQLMVEATVEGTNSRKLTVEEITAHAITFMMAGYETTANALSYVSYLLALNPHVQEKLQEEIDKFYEENEEVSPYKATQELEYLDMVVQEALRLYPPAPVFTRECKKEYKYKEMTIPKGCIVTFPSYLLHKDPDYWKDPEKFDPMRFSAEAKAERPQHCYMPFGSGPRNCIGMRFALLEAKMALIEILKRFTFIRAPDTQVPLETVLGITMSPKNGIHIRIVSGQTK